MRLPEMLVTTLERYIPINKQDLALLKGELTDKYLNILNSMETKKDKNAPIIKEIEEKNKALDQLDPHSPEYDQVLTDMDMLSRKLEKQTIFEKAIGFLEKPLVRVLLMVGFLIFSRWLIKKLTSKPEEEKDTEEVLQPQEQFFNQSWNPYGSQQQPQGYWVPFNGQAHSQQFQQSNRR